MKKEKYSVSFIPASMSDIIRWSSPFRANAESGSSKKNRDDVTVVIGTKSTSVLERQGTDDSSAIVKIDCFSVHVGGKEVMKNASLRILYGKKYGLGGFNGMVHSTLLKVLAWRKIHVPVDVLLVEEDMVGDGKSAIEAVVVSTNEELVKLREEAGLFEIFESDFDERPAYKLLAGLGFTTDMRLRPTSSFTREWMLRISLARALYLEPSLLLIDQRVIDSLDNSALKWLEEYLCSYKKTLVVASRNNDFIKTVCSEIIHINETNFDFYRGLNSFEGSSSKANAKREFFKEDRDDFSVVIGTKSTSMLQRKDTGDSNAKDIVKIDYFSVYVRGKEVVKNACLKISHGKKYGLGGDNGMVQSTLLKLLAWRKIPISTDILLVEEDMVGDGKSAIEAVVVSTNEELATLREEAGLFEKEQEEVETDFSERPAYKLLAGLGFTKDMRLRSTSSFSREWMMRVSLARALYLEPSLLLIDQPVIDNLDNNALKWLEEYLCSYKKTIVIASRNNDFIKTVCSDIIHLHERSLA